MLVHSSRLVSLVGKRSWGILGLAGIGAHFAMQAIERVMQQAGEEDGPKRVELSQAFFVDPDPAARAFADLLLNSERRKKRQALVCIFGAYQELGNTCSACSAHGRDCRIPDSEFLIACSSYVMASAVAVQRSAQAPARGLLNYLDSHSSVLMVTHVNTDGVNEASDSAPRGGDEFEAEIHSREFEGQRMALSARLFGTPQTVKLFYSCFFKVGGSGSDAMDMESRTLSDAFQTLRCLTQANQIVPPSATDLVFADDDAVVEQELVRRVALGRPLGGEGKWMEEHRKMYERLRLSSAVGPLDRRSAESAWYSTLSPQQRSSLVYLQHYTRCSLQGKEAHRLPAMIDLGWPISSAHVSGVSTSGSRGAVLMPASSTAMWLQSLTTPRLMQPEENLLMNGWPMFDPEARAIVATCAPSLKWALCAVPLPPLLAVLHSCFSCMSWRNIAQAPTASMDDVAAAEALLRSLDA